MTDHKARYQRELGILRRVIDDELYVPDPKDALALAAYCFPEIVTPNPDYVPAMSDTEWSRVRSALMKARS